jgi:hypothetical protein
LETLTERDISSRRQILIAPVCNLQLLYSNCILNIVDIQIQLKGSDHPNIGEHECYNVTICQLRRFHVWSISCSVIYSGFLLLCVMYHFLKYAYSFYPHRLELDRLCGLVVRVAGYDQEVWVQFPALPNFLRSSGSTQPREYN